MDGDRYGDRDGYSDKYRDGDRDGVGEAMGSETRMVPVPLFCIEVMLHGQGWRLAV